MSSTSPSFEKILILGHSGFIGRHLVETFKRHLGAEAVLGHSKPHLDLTDEKQAATLKNSLTSKTLVVVCAALKRHLGDTAENFMANSKIAVNLGKLFEECPVNRVIFFSSAAVYGEEIHNTDITERTALNPTSYYGMAKLASEFVLKKSLEKQKTPLIIFRPPVIYGAGEQEVNYSPSGFLKTHRGESPITVWGDGSELREFIYIKDIAELTWQLAISNHEGPVNIASGRSYTFSEVIQSLKKLFPDLRTNSRERSKGKVDHKFRGDLLKAWLPQFKFMTLDQGLEDMVRTLSTKTKES